MHPFAPTSSPLKRAGWLCALAATTLLAACATPAPRAPVSPDRVQVNWAPNDKLAEVRDNPVWRGWLKPEDWQKSLSEHLAKQADAALPPGQRLEVHIDDIKLAGDYEPWRGPNLQDVRIMKDLYPPRIDLHYRVVAADGSVLHEGDDKLRDMSYLDRPISFSNDPLRYDKRLLDDWLRKDVVKG